MYISSPLSDALHAFFSSLSLLRMQESVLFFLCLCLFASCSFSFASRDVRVHLSDESPYQELSSQKIWYSLSYTTASGKIQTVYVPDSTKTVTVSVDNDVAIYFSASPLGIFNPLGAVLLPGGQRDVYLKRKYGVLTSFFLTLDQDYSSIVNCVDYEKIRDKLEGLDALDTFDSQSLSKDLLNGTLSSSSFKTFDPVCVMVSDVPAGHWISEDPRLDNFWIEQEAVPVSLLLNEGYHRYINFKEQYQLTIIVSAQEKKYFKRVEKAPPLLFP